MRPKRALLAAAVCVCMLLSACSELTDVDQKAIIIGAGVDVGSTPDTTVVGIDYLVPGGGQGSQGGTLLGGGGSSESAQGVAACDEGTSVAAGFQQLRDETERFIYMGNLGLIAVGPSLAKQGVLPSLNYFLRDGQVAEATQVVVTQGPACAFLQNKTAASSDIGLALFRYLQNAETSNFPVSPNVLWRFYRGVYSPAEASYAPLVAASDQGAPFRIVGTAVFLRGKQAGTVSGYQKAVFDWLVKKAGYPEALVNLPSASQPAALRVRTIKKSIRVLGPDEVVLTMKFGTQVRQGNITLGSGDLTPLETAMGDQLRAQVRAVLDQLQAQGTDVLGIGDQVLARYPAEAADWPAVFAHMTIDLNVQVRLFEGGRMP